MNVKKSVFLGLLILVWVSLTCSAAPARGHWNIEGEPPFVLAHYLDWFSTDQPLAGKTWEHWSVDGKHPHDATKYLSDGRRDVASVLYPLIGTYDSNNPDVVRYHLATMKVAGIKGIIVDWYGKGHGSDECLPVIFKEAEKLDMKAALCFEEKNFCVWMHPKTRQEMIENVTRALTYAMTTWMSEKAYLRRDGIPFVMQFDSWGTRPDGPAYLSPAEWKIVFGRLPGKLVYCKQNLNPAYYPTLQGAYIWWNEGPASQQFAEDAGALRDQGKMKFFMSMLGVGFNDTGVWGWGDGPRVSKNYGLGVLQHLEKYADKNSPELIQCVTWNDFNEGTCFEPTTKYGFAWVDEVAKYIGRLHGGPVNLEDNRQAYRDYVRSTNKTERSELPKVSPGLFDVK
jgi:Glycosyl hydrolase family 99